MTCCTQFKENRWWVLLAFIGVTVAGLIYFQMKDTRDMCPLHATFTTEHREKVDVFPCKFPSKTERNGSPQYFDYYQTKAVKDGYFPASSASLKQRLLGAELPDAQSLDKLAQGIKHSMQWDIYKPGCKRIALLGASKLADMGIPESKINVEFLLGDNGNDDSFPHYVTTVDMGKDAPMVLDFKPSIDHGCKSGQCEDITWQQMHPNGYYPPNSKYTRAVGEDSVHKEQLYHRIKRNSYKREFDLFWGADKAASEGIGPEWDQLVPVLSHSRLRLDYLMSLEGDSWQTKQPFPDTDEFKSLTAQAVSDGVTSMQDFFQRYERPALEKYYSPWCPSKSR